MADEWLADDRLDELLFGADLSSGLQALERARGLVLSAQERPSPLSASRSAAAKSAMSHKAPDSASPSSAEEQTHTQATMAASSASASASSSTPLVSSTWLNWENPLAATKISPGLPEDTQELRRQKTRDAMRRSRQRQRDQLQQLRDAVNDLEQQYSQMCLVTERDLAVSHRSTDLADAVALSKRLGAENLMLKSSIQRQETWRQQLNVVMESRAYNNPNSSSSRIAAAAAGIASAPGPMMAHPQSLPFRPEILDPLEAKSVFGFRPMTEDDVKDVILANTRTVKRVQRQLLLGRSGSGGGLGEEGVLDKPVATMDVFGWDVRQRVRGSHMEFVFTKRFHDVSISEIMHKSWVGEMHLKGMQKVKYDTQRLEILQEVSPNAYVLGREVLSPDSTPRFRTTLVRYRMESPPEPFLPSPSNDDDDNQSELVASGYVIGTYSINPDAAGSQSAASYARELSGDVLWADLSYSIEFLSIADAHTGVEQYVEVRWSGSTNYKSQFHAYRNTADKISTLLHWEMLHIGSVAQIIPTSPRGGR